MRPWIFVLGLALIVNAQAGPVDAPKQYRAAAAITLLPGEGLQRLSLNWPVLQASRSAGLADLRVFDAQGQAVPFALAQEALPVEQQRSVDVPRFAWPDAPTADQTTGVQLRLDRSGAVLSVATSAGKRELPKNAAKVWLLDLTRLSAPSEGSRDNRDSRDSRISRIDLDWQHEPNGLSTTVSAESSQDGRQWQTVTQAQLLALSNAAAEPLSLKTIAWPPEAERPRYLRLRFDTAIALTGSSARLTRLKAPDLPLQTVRFEPVAATAGQPAFWQLDLQAPIAPQSLALALPELNSLLSLRLEQRNRAEEAWRPVSRFVAWRLQKDGKESTSEALRLTPPPARFWRLLADSPDAALQAQPLAAQIGWRAPQLVVLAKAGGLRLTIGRAGAASTALPLAQLMPAYQSGDEFKLPSAGLGELVAQTPAEPGWRERLSAASAEDQRRWVLWAVLVAAVLGLGGLALRLVKQIKPEQGA